MMVGIPSTNNEAICSSSSTNYCVTTTVRNWYAFDTTVIVPMGTGKAHVEHNVCGGRARNAVRIIKNCPVQGDPDVTFFL